MVMISLSLKTWVCFKALHSKEDVEKIFKSALMNDASWFVLLKVTPPILHCEYHLGVPLPNVKKHYFVATERAAMSDKFPQVMSLESGSLPLQTSSSKMNRDVGKK